MSPATANDITFMTWEVEKAKANLLFHQSTWERCHPMARPAGIFLDGEDRLVVLIGDNG